MERGYGGNSRSAGCTFVQKPERFLHILGCLCCPSASRQGTGHAVLLACEIPALGSILLVASSPARTCAVLLGADTGGHV